MAAITERLRQAVALAQQLPEAEQDAVAAMMLAEMEADKKWTQLLEDPRSATMLQRMADAAVAEDEAHLTRDLDELL